MENTTKTATALSVAASVASSAIFIQTLATGFVPYRFQEYLSSFLARLSSQLTISVDEHNGPIANRMYQSVEAYLSTNLPPSTRHVQVTLQDDSDVLHVAMHPDEEVVDQFRHIEFTWKLVCREKEPRRTRRRHPNYSNRSYESVVPESKTFELTFHRKHREVAIKSYLPYIVERAKCIREESKMLKLHTNRDDYWTAVSLRHPATFETMAMDEVVKRELVEDLERFVRRKEYYRRVGRAWKRGYLLYGPPGTGKSSLVAAMANYLRFDVYDLELSNVGSNSELRSLLVGTANRSILVVEDIDCSAEFRPREKEKGLPEMGEEEKVTLSGLLNFVDGLWSSCGDERIIVFTTNNKGRLDTALLRPGRMDVHIHMSYCTPCGFRVLASNYHAIDNHPLFREIEGLIQEVEVTPAEVAEELMRSDDPNVALGGLIKLLREKKSNPQDQNH